MDVNIIELAPVLADTKKSIQYLRGHNLLLQDYFCCRNICSKVMDIGLKDKVIFQCKNCRKRYSICTRSFWSKSKLELPVLLSILYFFANSSTVTEVCKFLNRKVSKVSVIQWFNYFRDVMSIHISNNPIIFENTTVHVDETLI